jgi:hypothetical protein
VLAGIVDLHVHGGPSLLPRRGLDTEIVAANLAAGISLTVLKAHEGSTVERAAQCGGGALGGIVLNAPVGGPNPVAVEVAGQLGGRLVWMPTVSSRAHHASITTPELSIIKPVNFPLVPVVEDGKLVSAWYEVLDVVAEYDMVLASGHVSCREALVLFQAARLRGVKRMLVNHPMMSFLGWEDSMRPEFQRLGVYLELGIVPDLLGAKEDRPSLWLLDHYPDELLVFGSDLGHANYPSAGDVLPGWVEALEARIGSTRSAAIMTDNGRQLLGILKGAT